jgi:outer membrane receptor protein involved in Fe transport
VNRLALTSCVSASALVAATVVALPAHAQGVPPTNPNSTAAPTPGMAGQADPTAQGEVAPGAPGSPAGGPPAAGALSQTASGDDIVVTASVGDRTRFKSSISVSQVSNEAIQNFTPRSQAEILRTIPGIQTAANAGPGGNANIGVRGIPVSTGGSEYVSLQEDGLPVTLFGDIQFGNNDYWLRFDYTVDRVEAVRGGSASTFASQAPGAVINYISNTGEHDGGTIGYTEGLNFRQHQLNFNYGGHIDELTRFDVGGYLRQGTGIPARVDYNILRGYQVKANLTREFTDNKGYIRVLFKRLDERAPTSTSSPLLGNLDGDKVTGFDPYPGFDGRKGSVYSVYNRRFQYLDQSGSQRTATVDGIHPKVTSLGAQLHYNVNDTIKVDDNFRYTWMSGNFTTQFLNTTPTTSIIGSTVNGQTVGSIRYANGPSQGRAFTGSYVNTNPNIHVLMHDMGSLANNLSLSGKFALGPGQLSATAGWFHMAQEIDQTWFVNRQYSELKGHNAAALDLFSTTGTQLTAAGQAGFNDNWGAGPARNERLLYTDDAGFGQLGYTLGKLNLDGSVRFDRVSGKGFAQAGAPGPNSVVTDGLGSATIPSLLSGTAQPAERIDYLVSYTSWSAGALYSFTNNTSLFVRASRGGRFNADRRTLAGSVTNGVYSGGFFNADGSLNAGGKATAVNYLNQQEVGLKKRGHFSLFGRDNTYTTETTLFHSSLTEANYDFTRLTSTPPLPAQINNKYRAYGVEFTGNVAIGDFRMQANLTYTDAKIRDSTSDPTIIGNRPGGIPKFQYFISPSYDVGLFAIGASVDGQTASWANDNNVYLIKESHIVNAFLKVRPVQRLELGLNVNNLFNTIAVRGGSGYLSLNQNQLLLAPTVSFGRTVEASVRFTF